MKIYITYTEKHRIDFTDSYETKEYDFVITGVSLSNPKDLGQEYIELNDNSIDIQVGTIVYVLYMTYRGSAFSPDFSGKGQILWVFKSRDLAISAKQKFESIRKDILIHITADDGETKTIHNMSYGGLESVIIQPCAVYP